MDKFILKATIATLLFPPLGVAMLISERKNNEEILRKSNDNLERMSALNKEMLKSHSEERAQMKDMLEKSWKEKDELKKENKILKQDIHDFKMEIKKSRK